MKRLFYIAAFLLIALFEASAQNVIRVEAPDVVAVNEQFNVTFIIEGEKSPSDFQWSQGDDFQLVWGPQRGSSSSVQIINGKRSSSHQTTFTYILIPKSTGTFPPRAFLIVATLLMLTLNLVISLYTLFKRSEHCFAMQNYNQNSNPQSRKPFIPNKKKQPENLLSQRSEYQSEPTHRKLGQTILRFNPKIA